MDLFIHFALHAAYALGIPASRPASLPTQRSLYTVLRGPFAHKKSQENFEKVVHKRALKVWDAHPDVLAKWIKYLEINSLAGVGMRIVRWERAELGFGAKNLAEVDSAQKSLLKQRKTAKSKSTNQQVQELADRIIETELAAMAAAAALERPGDIASKSAPIPNVDEILLSTSSSASPEVTNTASASHSTSSEPISDTFRETPLDGPSITSTPIENIPLEPSTTTPALEILSISAPSDSSISVVRLSFCTSLSHAITDLELYVSAL